MLHITVACYFPTPNLIYTPILKAQALNLAPFLKALALNLAPFLKAQALNLAPFLKAQALNLAPFLKAQALNLALTPFTYPTFKHKLSDVNPVRNKPQNPQQRVVVECPKIPKYSDLEYLLITLVLRKENSTKTLKYGKRHKDDQPLISCKSK